MTHELLAESTSLLTLWAALETGVLESPEELGAVVEAGVAAVLVAPELTAPVPAVVDVPQRPLTWVWPAWASPP